MGLRAASNQRALLEGTCHTFIRFPDQFQVYFDAENSTNACRPLPTGRDDGLHAAHEQGTCFGGRGSSLMPCPSTREGTQLAPSLSACRAIRWRLSSRAARPACVRWQWLPGSTEDLGGPDYTLAEGCHGKPGRLDRVCSTSAYTMPLLTTTLGYKHGTGSPENQPHL